MGERSGGLAYLPGSASWRPVGTSRAPLVPTATRDLYEKANTCIECAKNDDTRNATDCGTTCNTHGSVRTYYEHLPSEREVFKQR